MSIISTVTEEWVPLIHSVRVIASNEGCDLARFSEANILAPFLGARFERKGEGSGTLCRASDLEAIWEVVAPEPSALEAEVASFLHTLGYAFTQASFEPIYPKQLDFYFPELSLAIEVNGDYWHRDPKREASKLARAKKANITLGFVWGSDWSARRSEVEAALTAFLSSKGESVPDLLTKLEGEEPKKAQTEDDYLIVPEGATLRTIIGLNIEATTQQYENLGSLYEDLLDRPLPIHDEYCWLCGDCIAFLAPQTEMDPRYAIAQWARFCGHPNPQRQRELIELIREHRKDELHIARNTGRYGSLSGELAIRLSQRLLDNIDLLLAAYPEDEELPTLPIPSEHKKSLLGAVVRAFELREAWTAMLAAADATHDDGTEETRQDESRWYDAEVRLETNQLAAFGLTLLDDPRGFEAALDKEGKIRFPFAQREVALSKLAGAGFIQREDDGKWRIGEEFSTWRHPDREAVNNVLRVFGESWLLERRVQDYSEEKTNG